MLELFDVNYKLLSENKSKELFSLRNDTFKDRLNWDVNCTDGMEFDQYDTDNTNYLFGVAHGKIICSVRFIETKYPNMITGTFASYFDKIDIPDGEYIESSRFFVDKKRAKEILNNKYPITNILFFSMINYAIKNAYVGIYTIVSHPMLTILKRSNWQLAIIERGLSEKNERIYLVYLPTDHENHNLLANKINDNDTFLMNTATQWPLSVSLIEKQV
ncbi:acyl-homoserine-lactone synthase [Yersinia mollaretii]|uniref:acyl-homoserine-lactone synthase n=1 Tax=Yersinia mollaretii TaxID=33060 RepID=UPI0011AABA85|nr:acyl-homoserine-lactone synthase [Yersinia mollaretii]MDN0111368.1 acyl-homoserine-lactone synthase [Yersinia mollaretii]